MNKQNHSVSDINNVAIKAVIIALYSIGKLYGPALDDLAKRYTELKKDKKFKEEHKIAFDKEIYRKNQTEIRKQAEIIVEPVKEVVSGALKNDFSLNPEYNLVSSTVINVLEEKFKIFLENLETYELIPYEDETKKELEKMELIPYEIPIRKELTVFQTQEQYILNAIEMGQEIKQRENENRIKEFSKIAIDQLEKAKQTKRQQYYATGLLSMCVTLALNTFLNSGGLDITKKLVADSTDSFIIEDIEEYFENNKILQDPFLEIHNQVLFEQLENSTKDNTYKAEFNRILTLKGIPLESKLDKILHSGATNYKNIFDFILEEPKISLSQALTKIIHSDITDFSNIFDYIMSIPYINREMKFDYIANSGITSYKNIFQYILRRPELKQYEAMNYIAHSKIATYEEKFMFFTSRDDLSIEQMVVYTLLIPDASFERILNDFLKSEGVNQEIIIETVMNCDLVPFTTLFNTLLKQENVSKEQFIKYLVNYHADFNTVTLEEKINYVFTLNHFTETEKLDTMWALLEDYSIGQKFDFIFEFFETDFEEYLKVYSKKTKSLSEKQQRMVYLMDKVLNEMEAYIVANHNFNSIEELYKSHAVVAGEGAWDFKDYYWVANVFYNRTTNPNYVREHGANPFDQITAPSQFAVWGSGAWQDYFQPTNIDNIKRSELARLAVDIMFYLNDAGVCQSFLEFRWNGTDLYDVSIVPKGNRYGIQMSESSRLENENLVEDEIYSLKRTLESLKFS